MTFNWDIVIYGTLGALALLLQWFISRLLPRLPLNVCDALAQLGSREADGGSSGDGDIFNLDRLLMEAELERPGSTLRMYYHQRSTLLGRILGSLLVSCSLTGWVLKTIHFNCLSLVVFAVGIGFLLYPFLVWSYSRPRYTR